MTPATDPEPIERGTLGVVRDAAPDDCGDEAMMAYAIAALRSSGTAAAGRPFAKAGTLLGVAACVWVNAAAVAQGVPTGLPFDNYQASLAVTEYTPLSGLYPSNGGGGSVAGDTLGFVYDFAGAFAPSGSIAVQGQTLSINTNIALFSLLGTTYGGNGVSTFALPNLAGTAIVGAGQGPGLSNQFLGVPAGSATVSLTKAQLPAPTSTGAAVNNVQPSLPLTPLIATQGIYPASGGSIGSASFIGQIANFGGNFAPSGWMPANGQLLPISQYTALFSILGTTYGGNGQTTFALPDLRGRVAVGASAQTPLGAQFGAQTYVIGASQLPPGATTPLNNVQPSLAVNYLIATAGVFPATFGGTSLDANTPTLGEITEFAGGFVPSGWMLANGQLLSIAQNQALFSVIGTTYGGNGVTNFALPDLRDRTTVGTGLLQAGMVIGTNQLFLTAANIPAVPEPGDYALLGVGLLTIGLVARRRNTQVVIAQVAG